MSSKTNKNANSVVSGSASDDVIINDTVATNVSINALGGSDSILTYAPYTTINGGAGNDTINLKSNNNVIQYFASDASYDTIYGYNNTDIILIDYAYAANVS